MTDAPIQRVAPAGSDALLDLNNAHAAELSLLDGRRFEHLVRQSFMAVQVGTGHALLIAFDQDADYHSENFLWFRNRFARFVYVDRVVVAQHARGRGLAARLYNALFEAARAAGHERVVCEVNSQPPNPASDAFHAQMGFVEVGSAHLAGGEKQVRYFAKSL